MKLDKKIAHGLVASVVTGIIGQIIGGFFPTIGAASFAIILGILFGNTIFLDNKYYHGSKWAESELLAYSIVLMGATIQVSTLLNLGVLSFLYIMVQMMFTIVVAYVIGRYLGFSKKYCLLMSSGNAVCGSSAIASTAPVIDAHVKEKAMTITMVNVTGTLLMFILPILTGILYGNETIKSSALIGGTLQSVGQVIASAKFISNDVVTLSAVFKIIRIILLVFIVLVFSKLNVVEGKGLFHKPERKEGKINVSVPWFIIGFFILLIINSSGILPGIVGKYAKIISSQFEIIALAAIGMKVKIRDLIKEGPKAMLYGTLVGVFQVIFAILLIKYLVH